MAIKPKTFEELARDLEYYLYASNTEDFVYTPNVYDLIGYGTGGWKIHVGIGIKNPYDMEERKKVTDFIQEIIELIRKYDRKVCAKFATFKLMERLSNYEEFQRGKQITIYVPREHAEYVPIIARHLKYIIEKNADKDLVLVAADRNRNFPLDKDGIITIRWSSYFKPRPGIEERIDDQERYENVVEVTKRVGKYQELMEIYSTFKKLENARYLDRYTVENYLQKGESNKLKGNIVAIPFESGGERTYYAHIIEDIVYRDGKYKIIVRGLEGPYKNKLVEIDKDYISRTPEKLLRYKTLLIFIFSLIPISIFLVYSNSSSASGNLISRNQSTLILFLFALLLFFLIMLKYKWYKMVALGHIINLKFRKRLDVDK